MSRPTASNEKDDIKLTTDKEKDKEISSGSEVDANSKKEDSTGLTTPAATAQSKAPKQTLFARLPPWITTNLRSHQARGLWFRCWLSSWATVILILPNASLDILGNTAFFTILSSFFLPPTLPIQMFLFIMSTLVFGILFGWGLGCAAMKAALASRDQILLKSTLERVQSGAAGLANPEYQFKKAIFQGTFLDLRSSIVFGCFLGAGAFFFALIRAYAPKLTLLSIFGTIALDIFCGIGPLFPFVEYTLLDSMVTSIACFMAIATVVTLLVFPETMNHSCLASTIAQLGSIESLIGMQSEILDVSEADELAPGTDLYKRIAEARIGILGAQKALMAKSGFINLEFSWGRWNGDDVRSLEEPLVAIVTRVSSLQSFARLVGEPVSQAYNLAKAQTRKTNDRSGAISNLPSAAPSSATLPSTAETSNDAFLLQQIYTRQASFESEHNLHIEDMLPVIRDATSDLRKAAREGVSQVRASIDTVNERRWSSNTTHNTQCHAKLDEAIAKITLALEEFKTTNRKQLIEPYMPLLREATSKEARKKLPLRSLYLSYVFSTNLIVVADSLILFMQQVSDTLEKRKKNRLWAPKGLRAIKKVFTERREHEDAAAFGEDRAPEPAETESKAEVYRRDPDSRPPTNAVQKVMNIVHLLYKWSKTAEAMFTFKYTLITVALWLPGVFKSSANFYYVEKGLWALIMAQTTMNIYSSDQIFNYVIRLVGTFVGLCAGLATWYIGAGSGPGNHYGMAASTAVFLVPIVFVRLYSPIQYQAGVILGCATWALIVGYSWIDSHLAVVGAPGIGWTVAWKRWVLVVIGAGASFIIMMLPPTSSRKAVRLRNASNITSISEIYGYLISTWIGVTSKKTPTARAGWFKEFRLRLIALADQVQATQQMTALAKWEGSVRGKWPAEEYQKLVAAELEMIGGLAQLGGALGHLEDNWRVTFLHSTHFLHPNFISDVMSMFGLVSHSLRTAEPMHQVLPHTLLERLFYHRHTGMLPPNSDKKDQVDIEEMQSIDYMFYCTGLVAVYHLLQSLDELHRITKTLVGEVPLRGFDQWKDEYDRAHNMS